MRKNVREDERIEKIIRGLLKLPENRRCINCNSLGPQYVCTTFWTFVCTNCSGVHREFTHRVKSVSMAKFTAEEADALQVGGNERAKRIYFKEWDPQRHSLPDINNLHKLRDFIRDVYVERRYAGERREDKSPGSLQRDKGEIVACRSASHSPQYERGRSLSALWKSDEKSFSNHFGEREVESPKVESNRPGGASAWKSEEQTFKTYLNERIRKSSPRFAGNNEQRTLKYYFEERRSPRISTENSRYRKNPVQFEVVDDRIRDEDGRRYNLTRKSVELEKTKRSSHESAQNQVSSEKDKVASSESRKLEMTDQVEKKKEIAETLIDFETNPNPPNGDTANEKQLVPTSSKNDKQAVPHSEKERAQQAPDPNSIEALLFGISAPISGFSDNTTEALNNNYELLETTQVSSTSSIQSAVPPQRIPALPDNNTASSTMSKNNMPLQFSNEDTFSVTPNSTNATCSKLDDAQHFSTNQQRQYSASSIENHNMSTITGGQQQSSMKENIALEPSDASTEKTFLSVSQTAEGVDSIPLSSQRKELPSDLFTVSYSPVPQQFLGWQSGPQHNYGYEIQHYPQAMLTQAFPNLAKSTNPFDFNSELPLVQASQFPSMISLQGALQNITASTGGMGTSNFGPHPEMFNVPHSASSASGFPQNLAAFSQIMFPSPYMVEQVHNRVPPLSSEDFSDLSNIHGGALTSLNSNGESDNIYASTNFKSKNPFG